jgi:hypothetical protein
LAPLASLGTVQGQLAIDFLPIVTSLPFANLTSLGCLSIYGLDGMTDLTGFDSLRSVGATAPATSVCVAGFNSVVPSSIDIEQNATLQHLSALTPLTVAGQSITISGNPELLDIDFAGLAAPLASVTIENNALLTSVAGFSGVIALASLDIETNPALTSLTGFSALTNVSDSLTLNANSELASLSSLGQLRSAGVLTITNMAALVDLSDLAAISNITSLDLENDTALSNLDGLQAIISLTNFTVKDNSGDFTGLSSLRQITGVFSILGSSLSSPLTMTGLNELSSVMVLQVSGVGSGNALPFAALTSVGNFSVSASHLTNLSALTDLSTIGELSIKNNGYMSTIGLPANVTIGSLDVEDNAELPTPCATALESKSGPNPIVSGNENVASCP